MRHMRWLVAASAFFLLTGFFSSGGYKTITLATTSGYSTEGWLYSPKGDAKPVGIVFLHGKRGNPGNDHNRKFINNMKKAGYKVVAPVMPWSQKRGYDGTHEQGIEVISAAVNALDVERVVIVGHSMGAMGALHFGAQIDDPKVVGLVAVAARKLRQMSAADAARACELMESGKGNERASYPEMNMGKRYSITADAEYYCTFYSPTYFPDSQAAALDIDEPTYILSGRSDRLTRIYGHDVIFGNLPENPHNEHAVLDGKHLDVLYRHSNSIDAWISRL